MSSRLLDVIIYNTILTLFLFVKKELGGRGFHGRPAAYIGTFTVRHINTYGTVHKTWPLLSSG